MGSGGLWIERRALVGEDEEELRAHVVRLTIEGGSLAEPHGSERTSGGRNFLLGRDPSKWRMDVPAWREVECADVLSGVDFVLRPEGSSFAYDLHLAPEVDEGAVSLRIEGAEGLRLDREGGLVIETPLGELRQRRPVVWEVTRGGRKVPVASRFVLLGEERYGFRVERSDRARSLVIDPGFEWGTFLGDADFDRVNDVTVLDSGVVAVCGLSYSLEFPTVPGSYSTTLSGLSDAFLCVFSPNGQHLIHSTYLGGTNDDEAAALIELGATGFAVAGSTLSADFPMATTAWQPQHAGGSDGFLLQLNPSLQSITWGTFLGASGNERIRDLSESSEGLDVCGSTSSPGFPTTAGSWQTSFGGGNGVTGDGFLTRFNGSLDQLRWSTFVGGSQNDVAVSLESNGVGYVLLAGSTSSTNFPVTPGALDTIHNGSTDGFVALVNWTGQLADFCTFLGGSGTDVVEDVRFGPLNQALVGGSTESSDFPVTPGSHDTTYGGLGDGFLSRISADGGALSWSTFLGGDDYDRVSALKFSDSVGVVAVGATRSVDFPVTDYAYDRSFNGVPGLGFSDSFLTAFQPDGGLEYSTFIGGHHDDEALGVALHGDACIVVGNTSSYNHPVGGLAFDTSYDYSGVPDGFCLRMTLDRYPLLYGTGKVTSWGYVPEVFPGGFPSAANGPYTIWVDAALPFEVGYFFHGPSARDLPFVGGSLLVGPPIQRGPLLQFDFVGGAGIQVDITPSMIGQTWYFQSWFTDPGDPWGVGLSGGLEVTWYP